MAFPPVSSERTLIWGANLTLYGNDDVIMFLPSDSLGICLSEAGSHPLELWSIYLSFTDFSLLFFKAGSYYVAQSGLKLMNLLLLSKCWSYRLVPPHLAVAL
jgi:hypothetical protein